MLKDTPQLPLKMSTDTGYQQQPEGSYPFALNAVNNYEDGNRGSMVNEQSNYDFATLPGNYCGHITINRYEFAVFTDDGSISIVNTQLQSVNTVVTLPEFDFSTFNIITGEYKLVRGCENVIYWRDGVNPDRYFNYSNPDDFKTNGVFNVNRFNFIKNFRHPVISTNIIDSGGDTDYGSYFFCIEYVDNRGNTLFTSPLSIEYTVITGGYNIANYSPEVGGKPKSNSSIEVLLQNISTDYEFIRLNVVLHRSGNGISYFAHAVGRLLPITDKSMRFVYTGYNPDAGDYEIDANSLIIDKSTYTSSMVMEQVDNRLIRANLVESYRDYSAYQKYASKICTNYIVEDARAGDLTEIGGEVKAYGIVYIFRDGTVSPVFHIPGQRYDGEVQVGSNQLLIKTFEYPILQQTCTEEISYEITYALDGEVFTDSGLVNGTKLIATHNGTIDVISFNVNNPCFYTTVTYSIEANNLEFIPEWKKYSTAERITTIPEKIGKMGYYYSMEKYRDPENYCGDDFWGMDCEGFPLKGEYVRYHYLPDRMTEPLCVSTTSDTYNKIGVRFSNIDYPDPEIVSHYFVSNIRTPFNSIVADKGLVFKWEDTEENDKGRVIDYESSTAISKYGLISPEAMFTGKYISPDYIIAEHSVNYSSDTGSSKDDASFFRESQVEYSALKLYLKKHTINFYAAITKAYSKVLNTYILSPKTKLQIPGIELKNNSFSSSFPIVITEDENLANLGQVFYGAFKRALEPFPNVNSIIYRRITELGMNRSFNGDGFISNFNITNISWFNTDNKFNIPIAQINGDSVEYEFEFIQNIAVESTVNTLHRHTGTLNCNQHYTGFTNSNDFLYDWFIYKIVDISDGKPYLKEKPCAEWYGYNKDFSVNTSLNRYVNLPLLWNYCSSCTNKYPNRIIFSQKSFSEQLEDNYLTTLANDYVDIPGDTGEITGVDYKDGKLLVRTTYSSYFLQPNPQQLSTNESTVYIGTGEFLSIPALEINAEQTGYGGQQHILESINTEHGFIWIDRQKGKVFKFANGLEEISRFGMQYWFMRNLPGNNHCVLTYDPQYERLIITKQNEWSISYDFLTKGWTSFHSYLPEHYMFDGETFYSIVNNKIWRHKGAKTFCNFFNQQYQYMIEFVIKDFMNFDIYSVQYYATPYIYSNSRWVKDPSKVFTGMWAYNDFQSTGYLNLELDRGYDNIYFYPDKKHIKESDGMYKVSNIKAANKVVEVSTGDYPDKQPLPIEITSQYDLVPMSNRFAVIRLYLSDSSTKMITHLLNTIKQYNVR